MTCISLVLLDGGGADRGLERRLEASRLLKDHLIGRAGASFLLTTSDGKLRFEGASPLQLNISERDSEDLIALIAEKDVDFSPQAYRIYCDPFNTPSLVEDNLVADGFILKADTNYDSPEDNLRLLRALKKGAAIEAAYRRGGEPSAAFSRRILLARCGPYHPKTDEVLRPFQQAKGRGGVKLHVLAFSVKNARITVDNTFKPKTARL